MDAYRASAQPEEAAEHPLLAPSRGFIRSTWAAWLIPFGGTAIGVWLALFVDTIRDGTVQARDNLLNWRVGPPHWGDIAFWSVCVMWSLLLAWRLHDDDQVVLDRTGKMLHAIHKLPNLKVVQHYARKFFYPIVNALGPFVPAVPPTSADKAAERIREALTIIARLAQEFANTGEHASYGANVMLVAVKADFDALRPILRFVVDKRDTDSLRAILYLPAALLVGNIEASKPRHIPLIALPVPEKMKSGRGNQLALPGAPSALLGEPSVYMNTETMEHDCRDMAKEVIEQIRDYFAASGEGKDVRSFASFRLATADNPVGVLNIDSNGVCVLGESDEYYITFFALLEPFLAALALQVQEYAKLAGRPTSQTG